MWDWVQQAWMVPWVRAAVVVVGSFAAAYLFERAVLKALSRLAARTQTEIDDNLIKLLERPIYWSVLLIGIHWALRILAVSERVEFYSKACFRTIALALWSIAVVRSGRVILEHLAAREREGAIVQARTVPLFDVVLKTTVFGGGVYLAMLAWRVDVGAWLASAGIVGVAVGFAARDSLANYFAGIFIIADAPYKLRDVIILEDGTRGKVTDIGLRSTRVHTRDGIEINIPNSILGNMQIINASAGPTSAERITVLTSVAYGTDMRRVIELLSETGKGIEHVAHKRGTEVAFTSFGASGLDVEVRVWVKHPLHLEQVKHERHLQIYELLNEAEIEIPFPQQDIYVKELPSAA